MSENMISEEEKRKNKKASAFARACVGLEGFDFTEHEDALFERLDNGEITDEEFLSLAHECCDKKTEQG